MTSRPKRSVKVPERYSPEVSSLEDDESVDPEWDNDDIDDDEIIPKDEDDESEDGSYESDFVQDEVEYETDADETTDESILDSDDETVTEDDDDDDDDDDETDSDDDESELMAREIKAFERFLGKRRAALSAGGENQNQAQPPNPNKPNETDEALIMIYTKVMRACRDNKTFSMFLNTDQKVRYCMTYKIAKLPFDKEPDDVEKAVMFPFVFSYLKYENITTDTPMTILF
jgi:hypothetical protein